MIYSVEVQKRMGFFKEISSFFEHVENLEYDVIYESPHAKVFIFKDIQLPIIIEKVYSTNISELKQQFSERKHIFSLLGISINEHFSKIFRDDCQNDDYQNDDCQNVFKSKVVQYPIIISEDRWKCHKEFVKIRLLAHLQNHSQVFARNCEVRRINKPAADSFLAKYHSYGNALSRFRYGLFISKYNKKAPFRIGTLVGVSEFSSARRWLKNDKKISSYEWVRAAFLPHLRVAGGMSKMLKYFVQDVEADDVMTYADLEWSNGDAYSKLGFKKEGVRSPIVFVVITSNIQPTGTQLTTGNWRRVPIDDFLAKALNADYKTVKSMELEDKVAAVQIYNKSALFYMNLGSLKYRRKY